MVGPRLPALVARPSSSSGLPRSWRQTCAALANGGWRIAGFSEELLGLACTLPTELAEVTRDIVLGESVRPTTSSRGRIRDLLPLPWATLDAEDFAGLKERAGSLQRATDALGWLCLMVIYLNYSASGYKKAQRCAYFGPATEAQAKALSRLSYSALSFIDRNPNVTDLKNWADEVKSIRISYQGEEVARAETMTAAQILPALPPENLAGSLQVIDFCSEHVRRLLLNPDELRLPADQCPHLGTPPRIRAEAEDWKEIGDALARFGICTYLDESSLWKAHSRPVLSGAFGVRKKNKMVQMPNGTEAPLLRLIMNFTPFNAVQEALTCDLAELPAAAQWSHISLLGHEQLVLSTLDRTCYFYVFALPPQWWPGMAFRSLDDSGRFLCSRVVGMGWVSAVSIMEHAHRNIARACCDILRRQPLEGDADDRKSFGDLAQEAKLEGLNTRNEVVRNRAFPMLNEEGFSQAWSIYIDNFDFLEILDRDSAEDLAGTESCEVRRMEELYALARTPGNPDDKLLRGATAKLLGVITDGKAGRRDLPNMYAADLIQLTLWLLGQDRPRKRHVQVVAGRWVRLMELQRPTMSTFSEMWTWIGQEDFRREMPAGVATELICACFCAPFCWGNLRHALNGTVTASDASESGGGVCFTTGLTQLGMRFARLASPTCLHPALEEFGIVELDVSNGSCRRSWEILGLPAACYAVAGASKDSIRAAQINWPQVTNIEGEPPEWEDEIRRWHRQFLRCRIVLLGVSLRIGWADKEDETQRERDDACLDRFWQMWNALRKEFGHGRVHFMIEAPIDGRPELRQRLDSALEVQSVVACARHCSSARRTRVWWLSWGPEDRFREWPRIIGPDRFLPIVSTPRDPASWMDEAAEPACPGGCTSLPTFVRPCPRRQAPKEEMRGRYVSEEAEARWACDSWRYPVWHYEVQHLVREEDGLLRVTTASEREFILGFAENHSAYIWPSARIKSAKKDFEEVRCTIIGSSWSTIVAGFLLGSLTVDLGYLICAPTIDEILDGRTAHLALPTGSISERSPIDRRLHRAEVAVPDLPLAGRGLSEEQVVVQKHIITSTLKGSDVRITTGEIMDPKTLPRQEAQQKLWNWRTCISYKWKKEGSHINILEALAALSALKWRSRTGTLESEKVLHLVDSQVVLSVLAKHRSSSRALHSVIKRYSAYELASGRFCVHAYLRSASNPADLPSRRLIKVRPVRKDRPLKGNDK